MQTTLLEKLKEVKDIQMLSANYDDYMLGMANGLILAVHIMSEAQGVPQFVEKYKRSVKAD